MYNNDRSDLNARQARPENNSINPPPPQVWPVSEPTSFPLEQNNVAFYNPSTTQTPYFCPQPTTTHPQQTDSWAWSGEQNNNNNGTIFQPQNNTLNPQADPWQWSVDQSSESNQWVSPQTPVQHLNDQSQQPSYEQYPPPQPVPEQNYYYGQVSQEQWNYSEQQQQQQLGYQPEVNPSWSSWEQPNEPTWNPVALENNIENQPQPIMSVPPPQSTDLVDNATQPQQFEGNIAPVDPKHHEGCENPDLSAITEAPLQYSNEIQSDEPNQEVPEPVKPLDIPASASPARNSGNHEITELPISPDPPNEQVPCKNAPEIAQKPLVIQPWEGGPFQPPQNRPSTTEIVQKEAPEASVEEVIAAISKLEINKDGEETANMESEPDNLERPPEPHVNKVNPHHLALHKDHFAEELDSEAGKTNLWEQPNLPSVLLLPASASNDLSRSGSPGSNQAPPSIPVVVPSVESINNLATLDKTLATNNAPNSQTQSLQNTINNNEPILSELKKSPSSNEIVNASMKLSNSSLDKRGSQSPGLRGGTKNDVGNLPAPLRENQSGGEWDDGRQDPKNYRYREMEDLDNPYNRDRYYYNNDRNSRPSSRASEPVRSLYSSRYDDRNNDYEFSGPPRPDRIGTPSRVLGSEDDLRGARLSNDYRGDLRGSERDLREDYRNYRDPRDSRDSRIPKDNRYPDDYRDYRGQRDTRNVRDPRDPRETRDPRDVRDPRDLRDSRDPRETRDPRDPRETRDPRDPRDVRDPRDIRDSRDPRDARDPREIRDPRDNGELRGYSQERRSSQDFEADAKRGRGREDFPDQRGGYEDDQRQPYVRGGENDYYKMNRNYNKSGGYGYNNYYRPPDPYSMYYNYYNYPMNYNYGYYDELYRSNPKYREQVDSYRAYYSQMGYESDRMSSHSRSGRSSVNEDISKDSSRYQKDYDTSSEYSGYQNSLNFDNSQDTHLDSASVSRIATPPARLTPSKFSCPHAIAKIYPGKIIFSLPLASSISDTVQIRDLQQMLVTDKNVSELKSFPGPLISGETHKNDVIQFCQQKITVLQRNIEIQDRDSRILLWELLVLMLRQNGNVSGSDIAELLLKDRQQTKTATSNPSLIRQASTAGSSSSPSEDAAELPTLLTTSSDGHLIVNGSATPSPDEGIVVSQDNRLSGRRGSDGAPSLTTEQITEKFTEYLLFGHKKDALEWASKNGLWGHALFLASKMDSRSYANIMTRFANSLPLNDPLQTLYQLMSGRQPYSVTRLVDDKFGDWRVHLAMILSNLSSQPEVDCRSITTLGDTLAQRGCLSAAHFCYLMAQVEFGKFEQKSSKMVLLSSSHALTFSEFASNEAIQCTEIYEYAQSLANPTFVLTHLQPYKFLYATRLAEYGLLQESLHYCEALTLLAKKNPSSFSSSLLTNITEIAWKLKYHDPHYTQALGELEDIPDPEWLTQLLSLSKDYSYVNDAVKNTEETYPNESFQTSSYSTEHDSGGTWNAPEDQTGPYAQQSYVTQPNAEWNANQSVYSQPSYFGSYGQPEPHETAPVLTQSDSSDQQHNQQTSTLSNNFNNESPTKSSFDYYGSATTQFQAPPLSGRERQDSLDGLGGGGYGRRDSSFSNSSSTSILNNANAPSLAKQAQTKSAATAAASKKDPKGKPQAGTSWFGNIFGKIFPKGPNQAILPDDKNPTIIWDAKSNKWVNTLDEDGNSVDAAPVAPPKDSELKVSNFPGPPMVNNNFGGNNLPTSNSPPAPNNPTGVNRFQRPKFKSMRQNYVDVLNMNPSGGGLMNNYEAPPQQQPAAPENVFRNVDSTTPQIPNFFIPAPAPSTIDSPNDFVTQGHILLPNNETADSTPFASNGTPMFDPAEFSTAPKNTGGDLGQKQHAMGGYNLGSRRAYPS